MTMYKLTLIVLLNLGKYLIPSVWHLSQISTITKASILFLLHSKHEQNINNTLQFSLKKYRYNISDYRNIS